MALTRFLLFLLLELAFSAGTWRVSVPPCKSNWFGSPCRYECHCVNNTCDHDGECTETSACEKGWFGPSCQYVDLVAENTTSTTPAWVYDYPDTLCNTGQQTVTVSLKGTFYFTWLRLRANAIVSSQDFKLQLKSANGRAVGCSNMYTSSVSDTLLDIHCQPGVFSQELIITGAGVKSLCSVYISGGRNVALGQYTTQTSVYERMLSWRAVDGDSDVDYFHGSCTHTDLTDITPTWALLFQWPQHVNRYVLYNRYPHQQRLSGFIMEAVQLDGSVGFAYTDSTKTNPIIYNIQSNTPQIPISGVTIIATQKHLNQSILTLCEVKMFGDTACPTGRFGRDCENKCNCAMSGDSCFVSTGGCASGCAAGYQGEACQHLLPAQGPEECISVAVTVGLVVVFVMLNALIVIGVLIWRRRRHNTDATGQTTPHRYQSYPEDDSVQTLELNVTTTPYDAVIEQGNFPDYAYEVPINSTAQTQKARQLTSEDHGAYGNEANPYYCIED